MTESGGTLLCLNLRREQLGSFDAMHGAAMRNAVRYLSEARRDGWRILHAHSRGQRSGEDCGAIAGLEPLAEESVFALPGLSAFSDSDLIDALGATPDAQLHLIGAVFSRSGLATLLAAQEFGISVHVVTEACFTPRDDAVRAAEVLNLARYDGAAELQFSAAEQQWGNVVCLRPLKS